MPEDRNTILNAIWDSQNTAYSLMAEYDSLPHKYGDVFLHQTEAHLIDLVALHPNITVTDLARILRKTTSACSQIVKKLCTAGWMEQLRNKENKRQYNLRLTEDGRKIYRDHVDFENRCMQRTYHHLGQFTEEELRIHLAVQHRINEVYYEDVQMSRAHLAAAQT